MHLNISLVLSLVSLHISINFDYFNVLYTMYNHLSLLIRAKHDFKPTYNAADTIGGFAFFGGRFFLTCRIPIFTVLWNLRVKSTQFLGHFKWCR